MANLKQQTKSKATVVKQAPPHSSQRVILDTTGHNRIINLKETIPTSKLKQPSENLELLNVYEVAGEKYILSNEMAWRLFQGQFVSVKNPVTNKFEEEVAVNWMPKTQIEINSQIKREEKVLGVLDECIIINGVEGYPNGARLIKLKYAKKIYFEVNKNLIYPTIDKLFKEFFKLH